MNETVYVKIRARDEADARRKVKNLLKQDQSGKELRVFDYLSAGPEMVSKDEFEEVRRAENRRVKETVKSLIETLRVIDEYLEDPERTFRDQAIYMELVKVTLDARLLHPAHVSAPGRLTFDYADFEWEGDGEKETFFLKATRNS